MTEPGTIFGAPRATIVGVLNVTPDSFSDGGRFVGEAGRVDVDAAVEAARALVRAGADVIDVGGESTRPGAAEVSVEREIARTAPVIEALHKALRTPLSIDTRKARVAEAALDAGARIVNDVSGLGFDSALAPLVAERGAHLILGHLRGVPATMQHEIAFASVLDEVASELEGSVQRAREAGIPDTRLCVDPGLGFGKRLPHNLALLANPAALRDRLGLPVLVGPSRKSFLGELLGDPTLDRDGATAAACAITLFAGADGVRVHEVAGARQAARIALALRDARIDAPPHPEGGR